MNFNMQIKNNEDAQYKLEVLNTLVDIKNNTANIGDVVTLIRENNEYQDIIIKTLTEILLLTKEQNDKTILNKFNNIMDEA